MIILPYMVPSGPQLHVTEDYVSSPPALTITDERGDLWVLGIPIERERAPRGEYAFDVLRNGVPTGDKASRIERRGGRIRIFTEDGWKRWAGNTFI
jgi:hypothetical protein